MKKILASLLMVCASIAHAEKDVELSWEKASVYVPGNFFTRSVDVKLEQKYPVLLYLHGCGGPQPGHDSGWAKLVNEVGVVAITLDSFARPGRIKNCDPNRPGYGSWYFPQAYTYRQQEIQYAVAQLKNLPWVDQDNIFLMGFSEGGVATAQNKLPFKGAIILGWTCKNTLMSDFDGIKGPANMPVLAIAYDKDVWRVGRPTEGRCIEQDQYSRVQQVDLQGTSHEVYGSNIARKAVVDFLKQNLK